MYLDKNKVSKTLSTAKKQMIIGVIFVVVMAYGIVGGILNYDNLRPNLPVYVVLIFPFLWMIWLSVQNRKKVETATELNQLFCSDSDGDIHSSQLINILGSKNESEAAKTVSQLIGKGLLRNCTVQMQPRVHVLLYRGTTDDGTNGTSGGVVTVECPSCGARVEKRPGFTATCPYCDTKIS